MGKKLALVLFVASVSFFAFLYGVSVGRFETFPFQTLREAGVAAVTVVNAALYKVAKGTYIRFSDTPINSIEATRVERLAPDDQKRPVLIYGGLNQFLEYCPEFGCVGVEVNADGEVISSIPYRPREIFAANKLDDFPYEDLSFDFTVDINPLGIARYDNGDYLVTFHGEFTHPFGNGIARLKPDGYPVWYRRDYSHHWPRMMDKGIALVPAYSMGQERIKVTGLGHDFELPCSSARPLRDVIRYIDGDGKIVREIKLLDALLKSPYRAVLQQTTDGCDPTHLNFVDVIERTEGVGDTGLEKGDLIVSLRNISSFGILDGKTGLFKRLIRGTFLQQHSVQHLAGTRFLVFDNHGASDAGSASRLLMVDLASGIEKTVFPKKSVSGRYGNLFTKESGHIEISKDRKRALVAFSLQGIAFEVGLPDGEVYRVFRNIHDVSSLEYFPEQRRKSGAVFILNGVRYTEALEKK